MAAADGGIGPVEVRLLGQEQVQVPLSVAGSQVHAGGNSVRPTPGKADLQLFGGRPVGDDRQMYQSRRGEDTDDREDRNQGWWSLVWFGTQSRMTRSPASWAAATRPSRSSSEPNRGSTSV